MRSQLSHEYRFIEGLLKWYFGNQVRVGYKYDQDKSTAAILVNGQDPLRGRINAGELIKHLEEMGLKRLDEEG